MAKKNRKKRFRSVPFLGFLLTWVVAAFLIPSFELPFIMLTLFISILITLLLSNMVSRLNIAIDKKEKASAEAEARKKAEAEKKSYGPEVDAILEEGNRALREMGRLYLAIKDPEIRSKINDIMHITDKMAQDAINDPSDIPQIRKFFSYYLPTTIKLLNSYDRMSSQGITGDNLDRSIKSITDMLDSAVVAYRKRLDDLFANQALDIETDIEVLNTMLAREGLAGAKDFDQQAAPQ